MNTDLGSRVRWFVVCGYAMAMAWVESAVVFYLRTMVNRIEPYQTNPLPIMGGLGRAELVREAATLFMLLAVGVLAGRSWRSRLGYAAVAFGVWDIFYYVFLRMLCGWPHSLLDWDILFLLPLPWWGPVIAPVLISLLMIAWGTLATHERSLGDPRLDVIAWALNLSGVALALYIFMSDTLRVAAHGTDAVRNVLPLTFNWPWFSVSLAFLAGPPLLLFSRFLLRRANTSYGGPRGVPVAIAARITEPEL